MPKMPDKLTIEQRHVTTARSRNMAAIRGKDTKPEIIVRKYLWACGFRYRLNHPRLPGKPDIVLKKYKTCVFVNGCFWHGHKTSPPLTPPLKGEDLESSECCKIPKTNREFWVRKIMRNRERDEEVKKKLASMGWHSITIWECELRPAVREKTLRQLAFTLNSIFLKDRKVVQYVVPEDDAFAMAAEEEQQKPEINR